MNCTCWLFVELNAKFCVSCWSLGLLLVIGFPVTLPGPATPFEGAVGHQVERGTGEITAGIHQPDLRLYRTGSEIAADVDGRHSSAGKDRIWILAEFRLTVVGLDSNSQSVKQFCWLPFSTVPWLQISVGVPPTALKVIKLSTNTLPVPSAVDEIFALIGRGARQVQNGGVEGVLTAPIPRT